MTEKRFTRDEHTGYLYDNGEIVEDVMKLLNALNDEIEQLKSICQDHRDHANDFKADCVRLEKENEQLKKCLIEVKKDEKQLSIDFMGFKMRLRKQLQIHYSYANEQKQKYLNNPLLAKAYDIIRYDVEELADEMGVDLE